MNHKTQIDLGNPSSGVTEPESSRTEQGAERSRYPLGGAELAAVLAETGCSRAVCAKHAGCSSSLIDQFVNGEKPLSLDWIERFPPGVQVRLHERALARVRAKIEERLPPTPLPLPTHGLRTTQIGGELAGDIAEVMSDGIVTQAEKMRLAKTGIRLKTQVDHMLRDLDVRAVGGVR